jgi:hypothetical protein
VIPTQLEERLLSAYVSKIGGDRVGETAESAMK